MTWSFEADKKVNADPNSYDNLQNVLDSISRDWLNDIWYYSNILNWFLYCSFIASYRFTNDDYGTIINTCLEGSYYELQMAAEMYVA